MARDLLSRVLPIRDVRDHLENDTDGIAFDDQLPSDEVDRGDNCAVVLAAMEDEELPGVKDKVVRSIRGFVEAFFLKTRASIPWKLLKALETLQSMDLKSAEVKDGKSCH